MKIPISLRSSIPIKVLAPGLVGIAMRTLEMAIQNLFLKTPEQDSNNELELNFERRSNWLLCLVLETTNSLGRIIFEAYNNYLMFMLMMLFVNVILHGSAIIRYFFTKERNTATASGQKRAFLYLKKLPKQILGYSLIFCFYQALWTCLGSGISLQVLHQVTTEGSMKNTEILSTSRILEEGLSSHLPLQEFPKPSLSIGNILSHIDIHAVSIKLSKNGKTAFVATISPPTLKIIDVSDAESPIVLSTFLQKPSKYRIYRTLFLSPDETKLYTSTIEYLEVIDITNLKSPSIIATFQDKSALTTFDGERIDGVSKPNILISRDHKFLFVSGYGLQIFNISDPKNPALIRALRSKTSNTKVLVSASISLSQDGKTLYYSDGDFKVYDVENPKDIKEKSSFVMANLITSMMISDDEKIAFGLFQDRTSRILLQKLNISDINSISLGEVTPFIFLSSCQPVFMERTPGNVFLLIMYLDSSRSNMLLIYDTNGQHPVINTKTFLKDSTMAVLFTEDYSKVFIGNGNKLEIAELYLEHPNKNAFSLFNNKIETCDANYKAFITSKNESVFYSISKSSFGIQQISPEYNKLANISFYKSKEEILQMVISKDYTRAFWVSAKRIEIADISNSGNISILGNYIIQGADSRSKPYLTLSSDGKTGYLMTALDDKNYLDILDFSDPQNITKKGEAEFFYGTDFASAILSHDEQTIFVISNRLSVLNISDPSRPVLLKAIAVLTSETLGLIGNSLSGVLSPDGNTLVIRIFCSEYNSIFLQMINVSDVSSPQIFNEFRFPILTYAPIYGEQFLIFSADSQRIYITRTYSLMVLDVSNLYDPKYLGSIEILDDESGFVVDFSLSSDGRKAYVLTDQKKLITVSLEPIYSTFLVQDSLMLGERYNLGLQVIKMNRKYMTYDRIESDYRFTKFALVEPRSIQNVEFETAPLKAPPPWMNFDLKSQILTVEARRKIEIGTYRVYFGFSTQVAKFDLEISGAYKPDDIIAMLVAQGYLDSQRFLTESFGEIEDFLLPKEYNSIKENIYKSLKKSSFGTYNEIRVINSLNVSFEGDKLTVSTPSGANVKIEISLNGEEAQFLSRYYGSLLPLIANNKSKVALEGSLKDINLALGEIVINLPKDVKSCDGEIVIDDKLNPIRIESVKNISKYFDSNKPPALNNNFAKTIQTQVNEEPVYTGQRFQIKLNQKAFSDDYTEIDNLHYQLVFVKDNNETTVLPDWISFSDLTLTGVAPEEIFNREFEFKLIVKNEFQQHKEPLKINVKISSGFVLKLLMKYSPYILSILAVIIKANQIFNVIFKGLYKHPKNFHVRIGEEVTSEVLYPISFIMEEIKEAGRILKLLKKKFGLDCFILSDERKLDKVKILETTMRMLNELTHKEKLSFSLYLRGRGEETLHPRSIINKIIINTLTNYLLKLREEKETRKYFEKIKKQWPIFVKWDSMNSCFKINNEKFNGLLQKENVKESLLTNDNDESMENNLLYKTGINIDLLKDAILAYAFDCHNVNACSVHVQFHIKEKTKANFVKRFLKLNLKECPFKEKGKIGYGIGYGKKYNTISFNGVVDSDIIDKTLVLQITNSRQRILKELWIYGHIKNNEGNEGDLSHIEFEGEDYEML